MTKLLENSDCFRKDSRMIPSTEIMVHGHLSVTPVQDFKVFCPLQSSDGKAIVEQSWSPRRTSMNIE